MARWLGLASISALAFTLALGVGTADAQVFKPKSGSSSKKSEKTTTAKKASAKKQSRSGATKKRVTTKSKKSAAADRSRPDDLTPDPAPKDEDRDFVKITDDDEIE